MRRWTLGFALFADLASAVPVSVPHQGRILDALGAPSNGPATVRVALWDDATSAAVGDRLWYQDYPVTLNDGYYAVVLDTGAGGVPLDSSLFAGPVWLAVGVGATELGARQSIGTVPRAATAISAQSAATATSVTGGSVTTSGVTVTGAGTVVLGQTTGTTCATPGALVYDPTAEAVKVCVGTTWQGIGSGTGGSGGVESAGNPGTTCKQIHTDHPDLDSGLYYIRPDAGASEQVWCDMDTAPGGWTRTNVFQTGNNSWCANDGIWTLMRRIAAGKPNGGQLMAKTFYPGTSVSPAGPYAVATFGTGPYGNLTSMFAWSNTNENWRYDAQTSFGFSVVAGPTAGNLVWWDLGSTPTTKANFCLGSVHFSCLHTRVAACPSQIYVDGAWRSSAAFELYVLEP